MLATELQEVDGRFTGRAAGTPCFREGKVKRLEEWLADRGERLGDYAESWFYSDSINDVPLLSAVSNPVAVHPDDKLRAHATEHGWPILSLDRVKCRCPVEVTQMHFAILGSGAVGGYYGAKLALAGQQVSFVARGAHLRAIRERGLMVWSPLGDFTVRAQAEADPSTIGPVDVVMLAVKTYDNKTAVPMLKPLLGPSTVVLTLQNGVDSVDEVARRSAGSGAGPRPCHRALVARSDRTDGHAPAHRVWRGVW